MNFPFFLPYEIWTLCVGVTFLRSKTKQNRTEQNEPEKVALERERLLLVSCCVSNQKPTRYSYTSALLARDDDAILD